MASQPILLLTHGGDYFTIDRVEQCVRARGGAPLRVNTDLFPSQHRLTARFRGSEHELWLDTGEQAVRLDQVRAVWSRRLWPGAMPKDIEPAYAAYCTAEARRAFFGIFSLLDQAFWVNRIDRMLAAEDKLRQLRLAQELGLRVPDTLITNDPSRVRPFFDEHGGSVVTKLLGALTQTMNGTGDFLYTSAVAEEDLEDVAGLQLAPQVFQPRVDKVAELRVVVVGRELFAGALDPRGSERARLDWRQATAADGLSWTRATLPEEVGAQALALTGRLGLTYAALDLLLDGDGAYHFLEVNPAGEWGWLERDLDLPIADAIARALVDGANE
jgi:glutathione synthase/RimK-type ligase-like ATP-grasp enzyme